MRDGGFRCAIGRFTRKRDDGRLGGDVDDPAEGSVAHGRKRRLAGGEGSGEVHVDRALEIGGRYRLGWRQARPVWTASLTCWALVTSIGTAITLRPTPRISSITRSSRDTSRRPTATSAPAQARETAIARPRPREAPVTGAVRPPSTPARSRPSRESALPRARVRASATGVSAFCEAIRLPWREAPRRPRRSPPRRERRPDN